VTTAVTLLEGECAAIGRDGLSEDRLPRLSFRGGVPLSHVQDEHAVGSKRPGERRKRARARIVVEEVIENPSAKNGIVAGCRQPQDIADCEGQHSALACQLGRDRHEFGRQIDAVNDVASPCKFGRISTGTAPGVK
jgi:hypothetical protein